MHPEVSVIIPCYNTEKYISEAIDSSVLQTYQDIEVIVVNDGSTDKSIEKIKAYGDKIIVIDQINKGAPSARNEGLKIARGNYIKFLDADDFLERDIIEKQISHFEEFGTEGHIAVYGNINMVNESGDVEWLRIQPEISDDQNGLATLIESAIVTSSPLYRKNDLANIGGFSENLKGNQEHEMNIRLFLSGVRFRHLNDVVYNHRVYYSTNRISCRRWPERDPLFMFRLIEHYIDLLKKNGMPINGRISSALATRLMSGARSLTLVSNKSLAGKHLRRALEICPEKTFKIGKRDWITKYYLFAEQIFGLHFTESVYQNMRKLRR